MVIKVTLQRESLIPYDQPAQIQLISRNSNFKNESRVYYHSIIFEESPTNFILETMLSTEKLPAEKLVECEN